MPTHDTNTTELRHLADCEFLYTTKRKGLVFDIYQDADDDDFPYSAVYCDPNDGQIECMAGDTPKAAMEVAMMVLSDTADECPPDDIF